MKLRGPIAWFAAGGTAIVMVAVLLKLLWGPFLQGTDSILEVHYFPSAAPAKEPIYRLVVSVDDLKAVGAELGVPLDPDAQVWNGIGRTSYLVITQDAPVLSAKRLHSSLNVVVLSNVKAPGLHFTLIHGDPRLGVKFSGEM